MKLLSVVTIFLVRLYQSAISPLLGGGKCRFYPTCSEYAAEAVNKHGLFFGVRLSLRRLLRCGPWSAGGYDPVPEELEPEGCIRIRKKFKGNVSSSKG